MHAVRGSSYGDFYAKVVCGEVGCDCRCGSRPDGDDDIAEGDDGKLIKKFICDDGLLNVLTTKGTDREAGGVPTLRQNTTKLEGKRVANVYNTPITAEV